MLIDIESWISKYSDHIPKDKIALIKVKIPNELRESMLIVLNRMNINHLTLFPDLEGASLYANMALKINKYDAD